jgi:1-acyl-sn-glycerol-3-phosphate acyltransferase
MFPRVRMYVRVLLTFGFCMVMFLYAQVLGLLSLGRPVRRYHLLCRGMSQWGYTVARIWGMRIHVTGQPPRAPFVLVTNHISYTDIVLLCAVCPAWFISKADVAAWPGIGALTRSANTLFLNRELRRDVQRMNEVISQLLANQGGLIFFPEGTTSDGRDVQPFKPSLLQPAVDQHMPVHVAGIRYRTTPPSPPAPDIVAWVGDTAFAPHAKKLLQLSSFDCFIAFGSEPVDGGDRKELARRTRDAVTSLVESLP